MSRGPALNMPSDDDYINLTTLAKMLRMTSVRVRKLLEETDTPTYKLPFNNQVTLIATSDVEDLQNYLRSPQRRS